MSRSINISKRNWALPLTSVHLVNLHYTNWSEARGGKFQNKTKPAVKICIFAKPQKKCLKQTKLIMHIATVENTSTCGFMLVHLATLFAIPVQLLV